MNDDLKYIIKKIALYNAIKYNGKTKSEIVLSKILANKPEIRNKAKELFHEVSEIINVINKLSLSQQKNEIKKYHQNIKISKQRTTLPLLKNAEHGKVITRFAPEPNGYLHIGHAKSVIISEEYARMYDGKLVLRIDDTNPTNERLEYYNSIKTDLKWLGIHYTKIKNSSDDIELMYKKCVEMIECKMAYVCTCKRITIRNNRRDKTACKCVLNTKDQNYKKWRAMFTDYKSCEAVIRFRGNMQSENTVMRDPVLFRIIDKGHPILKTKYRVWPSYDFSIAIEDSIDGITHAFRSKEYELRNELYDAILDALKMRKPHMLEFSRLELKGIPVSKRDIKLLITEKKISGYDDPRLSTLESMRRRGILPKAIRKFVLSLSFTKSNTLAPFEVLESFNRKMIDIKSIRLNLIKNPKKLIIKELPFKKIYIRKHPSIETEKREINVDENFYISNDDALKFKISDKIRLIGLCNVVIESVNGDYIESKFIDNKINVKFKKIQWISKNDLQLLEIWIPKEIYINKKFNIRSLEKLMVYTEQYYLKLITGTEIQFIRFGYCRKDSDRIAVYTHK